jgi:circadian clock protein KaiC
MNKPKDHAVSLNALPKVPTGIQGLDDILEGGLPKGRPTLVCGGTGSGKTLLAMEFLVRGARQYQEPGVLAAFEETGEDLSQNVASLGLELNQLIAKKKMLIEYAHVDRSEIRVTGDYSLEGLFVRLGQAIDAIGARRVVLDSIDTLFAGLTNVAVLRGELGRLFRWLKEKGVTAIITAESEEGSLTRHGLEGYASDCVILLDHRVNNQIATRRLRVVKFRGSRHGTDEYPFLIGEHGLSVLPVTSLGLTHTALTERIPTGIPRLDMMLGGKGYYRGSSVLVSGTAGTGKTSLAAHLAAAACKHGERCLFFLFEESPSQIVRNMRSIGINLEPWITNGQLQFHAARPTLFSLETHLVSMYRLTKTFMPSVVVIDPITNLISVGTLIEVRSMLARVIDYFKINHVTAFFTSLMHGDHNGETADMGISSLMDTWLLLKDIEADGERNRVLHVLKSRGMAHSNQVCEFRLTDGGIDLIDVYVGPGGVLTGKARLAQEAREKDEELNRREEVGRRKHELGRRRQAIQARMDAMRLELETAEEELAKIGAQEKLRREARAHHCANTPRAPHASPGANRAHSHKTSTGKECSL